MNKKVRSWWRNCKRRIERRLNKSDLCGTQRPVMTARNIQYETAERSRGIACGGIGAMHLVARQIGLIDAIDDRLHLLKIHRPYHESDHVLNLAYNPLCGGTCTEDIELRRNDEVFLDALGAQRIPDPTTAGDFCRRFRIEDVAILQDTYDTVRRRVWAQQPAEFFTQAIVEFDGHLVQTTGECKEGMDIAYDGTWGYHPLVVSLANTGEVLRIVNRSGNRPSHEHAAEEADRAIALCRGAGFERVLLRGDTDFSQTEHLDRWDANPRVRFIFGYDATPNLKRLAEDLPKNAWSRLERPPRCEAETEPRQRPDRVKEQIVQQREYENQRLQSEDVAEFPYQPTACTKSYRMVVVRKNLSVEKGQQRLFEDCKYVFYITNEREGPTRAIVFGANDRCHQENLIEQHHNGVRSLRAPVGDLVSNWAYMVMTGLAWSLKAWAALLLPERPGRWQERHRAEKQALLKMEFKKFLNAFIRMPCQIVRTARRIVYRVMAWNPWQPVFFRLLSVLRC